MKQQNRNRKNPLKIVLWWQQLSRKLQQTRSYTRDRYRELQRRQRYYNEDNCEEPEQTRRPERITWLTAVRILLAELGENEYWHTLWHLVWRPGYVIADFLNGKRRKFIRPFHLLIGTSLLVSIALLIVPAEKKQVVSYETRLNQKMADENYRQQYSPEVIEFQYKIVRIVDAYYKWLDEHIAIGLLIKSILGIFFTWLLFRKSPRKDCPFVDDDTGTKKANYNFAEILTAHIFIISQLQMVNVVWILAAGWFVPHFDFQPYAYPYILANIIIFIDFQQLFGRKWYSTLWRTILCVIW